jgi:hypothetical protein
MKNYIRTMLDDLTKKNQPQEPADPPKTEGTFPPTVPEDLSNQELSDDPLERVRQLDFQAQQDEERERLE